MKNAPTPAPPPGELPESVDDALRVYVRKAMGPSLSSRDEAYCALRAAILAHAARAAEEMRAALPTRGDVGRPEMTRDPVFLLRTRDRHRQPSDDRWKVEGVWFTREEAEQFGLHNEHNWPRDKYGKRWMVYCVPADGALATLLKIVTARTLAPAGHAKGGGA